jgi:hypothetical protein
MMNSAMAIRLVFGTTALLIATAAISAAPQPVPDLPAFWQEIGLSSEQIAGIERGQAVAKAQPPRTPAEVFLVGAVYIQAAPESYLKLSQDFERRRRLPNYLALRVFSNPPRPSDLKGFAFDDEDIKALQACKPGDCLIQLPATSIEDLHRSIDWSAANAGEQVNQHLQKTALQRLLAYQRDGNQALGAYNDKRDAVEVAQQFAYMLSYSKALPVYLPAFYHYLLAYPGAQPPGVGSAFYWERVKFGLKPTLRVVHRITLRGEPPSLLVYAIAEKQLYASHYFETALDLSFCVRSSDERKRPGFYLIMAMSSEQAGLTGVKGSIVRKTAVGRSVSSLQNALQRIRAELEAGQ